jgi:hypothetical protein
MLDREVLVHVQGLRHGAASNGERVRRWPLRTLVAYLFDGRECDEVRSLLARGEATAHQSRVSFEPIELSAAEVSAIERSFPHGSPVGHFDPSEINGVDMRLPALHPILTVPIRATHPLISDAAARAAHLRFDYGPWADVYIATLTPDEAASLLADPARRVRDAGEAELAKRIVGEDDASLHFTVPRPGLRPPWAEAR